MSLICKLGDRKILVVLQGATAIKNSCVKIKKLFPQEANIMCHGQRCISCRPATETQIGGFDHSLGYVPPFQRGRHRLQEK